LPKKLEHPGNTHLFDALHHTQVAVDSLAASRTGSGSRLSPNPVSTRLPGPATATSIPSALRRSTVFALRTTRYALRDHAIPAAAVAPGHHGTAIGRAAFVDPLFQAGTDRSNFVQQDVTKLDLRGQYGLRRTARGQQMET